MLSHKPKINWARALAHPRDYELAQAERMRRAHTKAWADSASERGGRVCEFVGGTLAIGYDHRAELVDYTVPDKSTLRRQAHEARQQAQQDARAYRQTLGRANNRQAGGR